MKDEIEPLQGVALDLLDLTDDPEPGVYMVDSESATTYLLLIGVGRTKMARLPGPATRTRAWWDETLAPLVSLTAIHPVDREDRVDAQLRVGYRHHWVADPEGGMGSQNWWWLSRTCTNITRYPLDVLEDVLEGIEP